MTTTSGPTRSRTGRRPVTSRGDLERVALQLFVSNGFDETSADEIAAAAGVGRRTLFRYFASKNDMVWGDFDHELERLRDWFDECPSTTPVMQAVRDGVVAFNRFPRSVEASHRRRMILILNTPALQAHSTLRYAAWRDVIAEFAGRRLGLPPDHLRPRLLGHVALAASLTAYEEWLGSRTADLAALIREAFDVLAAPELTRTAVRRGRKSETTIV